MNSNKCIKRLTRRRDYLKRKIEFKEGSEGSLRWSESEMKALDWAIEFIDERSPKLTGQRDLSTRD